MIELGIGVILLIVWLIIGACVTEVDVARRGWMFFVPRGGRSWWGMTVFWPYVIWDWREL